MPKRTDRERRPVVMRRTERGLEPVSSADAEALAKYKVGFHLNVTIKQRRSNEQQGMYWAGLQRAVEATEAYPSAEHLHDAVKMALGFTSPLKLMDGSLVWIPDSTAFSAMDRAEFTAFFDRARKLVIEQMQFDPWAEPVAEAA